jgi:hypothetical protein
VVLVAGFCLLTVLAYVAYTRWLVATGRLPGSYLAQWSHVLGLLRSGPAGVAKQATSSLLVTYVYLGLFTLPLGLLFVGGASRPRLLVLLALSAVLLAAARLLPVHFAGNILSDRGVGPFTLAHSAGFGAFIGSPVSVALLGLLALVGGALLIEMLLRSIREIRLSLLGAVCLSLAALYFISVALVTQLDRYMLPYLPLLAIPALRHLHRKPPAKPALVAALTLTLAYAAFAVAAVHDYMSWNRVRWQAIGYLTDDLKVPVDQIDGGFEFNGLYARPGDRVHTPGSKPWQYKATEYVVAFDVLDGYVLTADFPVRTWLPAGVKRICLLKRHGPGLDTVP